MNRPETPKTWKWLAIFVITLIFISAVVYRLGHVRPPIPPEWRSIEVGMPRREVLARIPDEIRDLRELKGFDIAAREFRQWGIRRCWWQLTITYDSGNLVRMVEVRFTDPRFGVFNTGWMPLSRDASNKPGATNRQ